MGGSTDVASSEDSFLERWSRRKRDAGEADETDPAREAEAEPPAISEAEPPAISEADLPDVETLDESSDFTVFLQEGVPEALRRKALRRLWRLNPIFANLDGLNDYDEDFTDAATVVAGLKSLYQVGRGMVPEDEETEDPSDEAADAGPEPEAGPVPETTHKTAVAPNPEADPEPEAAPEPEAVPAPSRAVPNTPATARTRVIAKPRRDPLARRWGEIKS